MEGPGRGLDRAWTGPGQCIQKVLAWQNGRSQRISMHHDTILLFHYTHTSDKLLVQPVTLGRMRHIWQSLWELFAQPLDLLVAVDIAHLV